MAFVQGQLTAGSVIKYGGALYRVDFVNACRARIVPLSNKIASVDEFDVEAIKGVRGISISASSCVEVVTDLERARDQIELYHAQRELAAAQAEMDDLEKTALQLKEAEAALAQARSEAGIRAAARKAMPARTSPRGASGGWFPGPEPWPAFKAGTMADTVREYICAHPGQSTAEIVDGLKIEGAVAACVSRFNQAGFIHKA